MWPKILINIPHFDKKNNLLYMHRLWNMNTSHLDVLKKVWPSNRPAYTTPVISLGEKLLKPQTKRWDFCIVILSAVFHYCLLILRKWGALPTNITMLLLYQLRAGVTLFVSLSSQVWTCYVHLYQFASVTHLISNLLFCWWLPLLVLLLLVIMIF
jgi:hypothetical protein